MKLNLKKLNFKELFVQHIEKVIFGAMAVGLLLFIVAAVGERLADDKQPQVLKEKSTLAKQYIEKQEIPPDILGTTLEKFADRAIREPVKLAVYVPAVREINSPIIERKITRGEPELLSVTGLRVEGGFGQIVLLPPDALGQQPGGRPVAPIRNRNQAEQDDVEPGKGPRPILAAGGAPNVPTGAKLEVKYWAMITGLIPVRKQRDLYRAKFENAVNYNIELDLPTYFIGQIQRAEIDSSNPEKLNWQLIDLTKLKEFMLKWAPSPPEPVADEFVFPPFVQPLAPRADAFWNEERENIGHLPEILFAPKRGEMGDGRMMAGVERGGRNVGFENDGPRRRVGVPATNPLDLPAVEPDKDFPEVQPAPVDTTQIEEMEKQRKMQELIALVDDSMGQQSRQIHGVDHILFRFCDFTAEPGKKYVYRVRLGLRNPNFGMQARFLSKPELAKREIIPSPWSEPSPIVGIPLGDKTMVGPATPATATKEPTAKIHIVQLSETLGAQLPLVADVLRGSVANFTKRTVKYNDLPKGIVDETTANFVTDAVVLDIRGGRPVSSSPRLRTITEPGEILVLNRAGQLVAMNEFDDEEPWLQVAVPDEPKPGAIEDEKGSRPGGRNGGILEGDDGPRGGRRNMGPGGKAASATTTPAGPGRTRAPRGRGE